MNYYISCEGIWTTNPLRVHVVPKVSDLHAALLEQAGFPPWTPLQRTRRVVLCFLRSTMFQCPDSSSMPTEPKPSKPKRHPERLVLRLSVQGAWVACIRWQPEDRSNDRAMAGLPAFHICCRAGREALARVRACVTSVFESLSKTVGFTGTSGGRQLAAILPVYANS